MAGCCPEYPLRYQLKYLPPTPDGIGREDDDDGGGSSEEPEPPATNKFFSLWMMITSMNGRATLFAESHLCKSNDWTLTSNIGNPKNGQVDHRFGLTGFKQVDIYHSNKVKRNKRKKWNWHVTSKLQSWSESFQPVDGWYLNPNGSFQHVVVLLHSERAPYFEDHSPQKGWGVIIDNFWTRG